MAGSPPSFALVTVPLDGSGPARPLASTLTYASSPVGDRVALPENDASSGHLRVQDLGSDQDICQASGAFMNDAAFLSDGRGLLFTETPAAGARRLRYLALAGCAVTDLAELDGNRADGAIYPRAGYAVADPTACFAIVQSNAAATAGTSLVLLPE